VCRRAAAATGHERSAHAPPPLGCSGGAAGGTVGFVPVAAPGKYDGKTRTIAAHGSGVTDLAFSPFHDALLATASDDTAVKLWTIPDEGKTLTEATALLSGHTRRVESVKFHPTAGQVRWRDGGEACRPAMLTAPPPSPSVWRVRSTQVLATASGPDVRVWDAEKATARVTLNHGETGVPSLSWKAGGTLLATTGRDNKVRVWDPRAAPSGPTAEAAAHLGVKAAVVQWLGDLDRLVTTGFTKVQSLVPRGQPAWGGYGTARGRSRWPRPLQGHGPRTRADPRPRDHGVGHAQPDHADRPRDL